MNRLIGLGYYNRFDTYDVYTKEINNFQITVSKHITKHKWQCVLVEWHEGGNDSDEITLSFDCSYEWVCDLDKVLSMSKG